MAMVDVVYWLLMAQLRAIGLIQRSAALCDIRRVNWVNSLKSW